MTPAPWPWIERLLEKAVFVAALLLLASAVVLAVVFVVALWLYIKKVERKLELALERKESCQ